MNPSIKVDILLATYNGALFLERQLNSILTQTHTNWHLYIRDDGSIDNSRAILNYYLGQYPDKITIIEGQINTQKAKGNFSLLMNYSTAKYILFCDQDDIWLNNKVEISLQKILAIEKTTPNIPIYVFSDLKVIDSNDHIIHKSLWERDGLNSKFISLNRLLVQNVPYGCATIINKPLLNLGKNIPHEALLHDHWLALLAAAKGRIASISEPTILHRIHDKNTSRANNPHKKERSEDIRSMVTNKNFLNYFVKLQNQAAALLQRLREKNLLDNETEMILTDFINLRQMNIIKRKLVMIRHGFFKNSLKQTLKWLLRI